MKIKIKRFEELTTAELYEILRCRSEVFVLGQKCIYQDIDMIDQASTHIYYEEDGKIMAYLRVIDPGVKYSAASIGRVLTMKEYRGRGLSRSLMTEAIRIASTLSNNIEIEAQAYLREFYKSLGFKESSEVFMLENIPHISMVLNV
ncbi:MAG: GNAT family N-acetyltransferase [Barnesiella sp.]|nr:GNAT family N-acetyltransferase [Barnesiella sp.]MBD5258864.1 GNAT family N-acetyltransferase [Barnesiella sp.]